MNAGSITNITNPTEMTREQLNTELAQLQGWKVYDIKRWSNGKQTTFWEPHPHDNRAVPPDYLGNIEAAIELAAFVARKAMQDHNPDIDDRFRRWFGGVSFVGVIVTTSIDDICNCIACASYEALTGQPVKVVQEPETLSVNLNGKELAFTGDGATLRYEDAVELAGYERSRILSVIVVNPGEEGRILAPGKSVTIKDGCRVEAYDTSNA